MRIKVSQQNIEHGEQANCVECPVALAINGVLNNRAYAEVAGTYLLLSSRHTIKLSRRVRKWIKDFDTDQPVKPFQFNLDVPKELLK